VNGVHRNVLFGMAVAITSVSCGKDSELGSCGYGAQLDTTYACEQNVQVTTREQCSPDPPVVTRKDCSESSEKCLEMVGIPGATSRLFTCVRPCTADADCPTDFYCAGGFAATSDGGKTCVASLKEGFACDVTAPCASGLVCAIKGTAGSADADVPDAEAADAATPATCQPYTNLCSCQRP
jgi:hypothetical protein